MQENITIKTGLGFLILITSLFLGCGSTMSAPQAEGKTMAAKNEKSSSSPVNRGVGMRILWKISGYKIGPNPAWGEKEARAMLFKPLDITADAIVFDGKTCRNVTFKKEQLKTKEYLAAAFHATPQELDIAEEVMEVVKTNCDLPGFGQYLRLKDRRLVIYLNGVFFYFEPNVNY